MAYLPSAIPSPAIASGVLCWHQGDEFTITIELALTDNNGDSVTLGSGDSVTVVFAKKSGAAVKTFPFTSFTDNKIDLVFDATTSALFPMGHYTYDVVVEPSAGGRFTIANDNPVCVG